MVAEYWDEGVSGVKTKRPALDRLIADAHRRAFDVVLVWKLDRLRVLELIGKHVQVAAFRENVAVHSGDALVQQIYAGRERARAASEEALH